MLAVLLPVLRHSQQGHPAAAVSSLMGKDLRPNITYIPSAQLSRSLVARALFLGALVAGCPETLPANPEVWT